MSDKICSGCNLNKSVTMFELHTENGILIRNAVCMVCSYHSQSNSMHKTRFRDRSHKKYAQLQKDQNNVIGLKQ
jgi:hypothetical protein